MAHHRTTKNLKTNDVHAFAHPLHVLPRFSHFTTSFTWSTRLETMEKCGYLVFMTTLKLKQQITGKISVKSCLCMTFFLLKATRFQKNFTPNIPTDISFLDSFGLLEKLKRTVRLFESHLRNALRFTTFSWHKLSWTIALDQWAHENSVSYCKNSFWTIRAFTVRNNERS